MLSAAKDQRNEASLPIHSAIVMLSAAKHLGAQGETLRCTQGDKKGQRETFAALRACPERSERVTRNGHPIRQRALSARLLSRPRSLESWICVFG
jgi:hypothetical protein